MQSPPATSNRSQMVRALTAAIARSPGRKRDRARSASAQRPAARKPSDARDVQLAHLYDRARVELRRWVPLAATIEPWLAYERVLVATSQ